MKVLPNRGLVRLGVGRGREGAADETAWIVREDEEDAEEEAEEVEDEEEGDEVGSRRIARIGGGDVG